MDVVVLLKQVPLPKAMRVDPKTGLMDRTTAPSQINQDCQHALEMALLLKEQHGCRVVVLSMGPPSFQAAHITALERGVDETVLVSDRKLAGSDTYATGYTLAGALKHLGYTPENPDWLVLGGRQTTDGDTAHVPSQVAENIGVPQVTLAETVELDGATVSCRRIIEGGHMQLSMPLPAVISIAPTAPALRGRNVKASLRLKKEVQKDARGRESFKEGASLFRMLTAEQVGLDMTYVGLEGSPTIVAAAPDVDVPTRDLAMAADPAALRTIVEGWA